ncbi:Carboxylesterase [Aspergillus californicus]
MKLAIHDLKGLWLLFLLWTPSLAFIFNGPELEFGGVRYTPSQYNETGNYYLYSNIRYAAPPVGDLRWAKPQTPRASDPSVDPNADMTCTQVTPNWWNITGFPAGFTGGVEDCLFLDIYVPRNQTNHGKTPIMIHGGGFMTGSKTASGDPSGLLWAADEPIIYVAINYRLGGLGFLGGQEVARSGIANAGLHDQRAAFRWVHDHVAAFGGNPADITVFGESAGAASILYHLTAYGGKDCPLFRRAILQSSAFFPARGHANNEAR